jgi:hypothetical protein
LLVFVSGQINAAANLFATNSNLTHKFRQLRMAGDLDEYGETERVKYSADMIEEAGAKGYKRVVSERATYSADVEK